MDTVVAIIAAWFTLIITGAVHLYFIEGDEDGSI